MKVAMFWVKFFVLILIKQVLSDSEHIARSYDSLLLLATSQVASLLFLFVANESNKSYLRVISSESVERCDVLGQIYCDNSDKASFTQFRAYSSELWLVTFTNNIISSVIVVFVCW